MSGRPSRFWRSWRAPHVERPVPLPTARETQLELDFAEAAQVAAELAVLRDATVSHARRRLAAARLDVMGVARG